MSGPPPVGRWLVPSHLAGLAMVALGEVIAGPEARPVAWLAGGALAAAAAAARLALASRLPVAERRLEVQLGLVMVASSSLVPLAWLSAPRGASPGGPVTGGGDALRLCLLIAAALATLLPLVLSAIAIERQRGAARLEARRASEAARSGAVVAAAVLVGAAAVAAAGHVGWSFDGSTDRASGPGEATRGALAALPQPVRAVAFVHARSDMRPPVAAYLQDLEGERLRVELTDRGLSPALASELGVERDGVLALTMGEAIERVDLGSDTRGPGLRHIDPAVRHALVRLGRPARTVYWTSGHGELLEPGGPPGRRAEKLQVLLAAQGRTTRALGLASGLGHTVPDDAALVMVVGPTRPFAPEELASLEVYRARGGRLLVAIDPAAAGAAAALVRPLGLVVGSHPVALDAPLARRRSDPSDRGILVVTGDPDHGGAIVSHPSVASLARLGGRAQLLLAGAAPLHLAEPGARARFVLRSDPASFLDRDGDWSRGADEPSGPFQLAAAVEDDAGMRAFVVGDADALSDEALVSSESNGVLAQGVVRWLVGDDAMVGAPEPAGDVRVVHTRRGDALWFWCAIVGVPALVLALGAAVRARLAPRAGPRPGARLPGGAQPQGPRPRGPRPRGPQPRG